MSLIGLDIGDKKIGIAISESGVIAEELTTIKNDNLAIPFIIDLIKQKKVARLIIGLPLLESGDESLQAKKIKGFVMELTKRYPISVEYENEILTSKEAERILYEQGFGQEQIKARVDQMSAKIILEQYLNRI